MKTNYIPAYVMLAAGVVDSIILIIQHVELIVFLKQLLLVLVLFLVIGHILKLILDIGISRMADSTDVSPDDFMETEETSAEHMDSEHV
jgi:hypothetical protein